MFEYRIDYLSWIEGWTTVVDTFLLFLKKHDVTDYKRKTVKHVTLLQLDTYLVLSSFVHMQLEFEVSFLYCLSK